jgi:hypothetical protein
VKGRDPEYMEGYIKMGLKEMEREVWSGSIWLRIGSNGGLL